MRSYIVHSKETCAALERRDVRAHAPRGSPGGVPRAGNLTDEPFARHADEDGKTERHESP